MGKSKSTQVAITKEVLQTLPKEVQQRLTLLRGMLDLVHERWGYFLGRRITQQEMNDASTEERKAVREIQKEIRDNLEDYIRNSNIDEYLAKQKALKTARETVSEKTKPFRDKISPLRKAQKYLDTVAIPDALKELGKPVVPRFSLSEWVDKQIKAEKKK